MPRSDSLAKHKAKIAVALVLTFVSGLVDIVAFLGIFRLFTAHLTGTTVHLGRSVALGRTSDAIAALAVVVAFFLGSVAGRAIIEAGARRRFRSIASVTLAVEAAMIAFVAWANIVYGHASGDLRSGASPHVYAYLAMLAWAMGMQTATLTGIGPLTVHTTFVTGMVNKLAQLVSRILFRAFDFIRGRQDTPEKHAEQKAESEQAIFVFSIWVCYVLGAVGGTAAYMNWGMRALFVATAGLIIGIVTDVFTPLSIKEEREQSER